MLIYNTNIVDDRPDVWTVTTWSGYCSSQRAQTSAKASPVWTPEQDDFQNLTQSSLSDDTDKSFMNLLRVTVVSIHLTCCVSLSVFMLVYAM